jgi:hypothetical protein
MNNSSRLSTSVCGTLLAVFAGAAAAAAVQRTFVSTGGNDGNACSIAAPCRSFGAAIAQTQDKGEIVVLDSGGYGPVVINKSIEIIAPPGIYAGVTAGAGTGIQVVSPAQTVAIRGITINGLGTGQFGIDVQFGGTITIDRCRIANFTQDGLRFANAFALSLRDSDIRDNGGNGVVVTSGTHNTVERTTLRDNGNNSADVSGPTIVTFSDSVVARNLQAGIHVAGALATITGGEIVGNSQQGVFVDGSIPGSTTIVAIDRANISSNNNAGVLANATATNSIVQLTVARSVLMENFEGVIGGTTSGLAARSLPGLRAQSATIRTTPWAVRSRACPGFEARESRRVSASRRARSRFPYPGLPSSRERDSTGQ